MESELKKLRITEKRIELLNANGINTIKDIIMHFPYRYEIIEETKLVHDNKVVIEGVLVNDPRIFFKGRMSRMSLSVEHDGQIIAVTIFNRHFLKKNMVIGNSITIIGKYNQLKNSIVASDIKLKPLSEIEGIVPVYSLKEGLTQSAFHGYVKKALAYFKGHINDDVPELLMEKHHLINRELAYNNIHLPSSKKVLQEAIKYLKYEEFLKFQLTMQFIKSNRTKNTGIKKDFSLKKVKEFIGSLSFELTKDQSEVVKDIISDLKTDKTMYRFIQGDVGSGKTIVGAIGLYCNYLAGFQGAMMAPTEILASQHYHSLKSVFKNTNVKIELLTGSLTAKQKEAIYQELQLGHIDIVVGTHALFQEKVTFKNLSFVITDEQHRFGVEQRKALKEKGTNVDFLIMSATPIPRTLAISLYGDMDVSTIKTMPKGRKEIITNVIFSKSMKPILKPLNEYLETGGQCYVVCPLVDSSEAIDGRNAIQIHEAMSKYFKGRYEVGLLHGKMNDEQKQEQMLKFKNNEYQILVATTVIEVGVDVSAANMMIIYNSERFGLSQLHQLRGRVGRGDKQGYCYFLTSSKDDDVKERLEFLKDNNDGFEISMFDLKRRGPGEMLGNQQSGIPTFNIGDIFKDFDILEIARSDAADIINENWDDEISIKLVKSIQDALKKNNVYID